MKEINKAARLIKSELAGRNYHYYKTVTIYLDTRDDELFVKFLGQCEEFRPGKYLIPLCRYSSRYGDWADDFGDNNKWQISKKRIANDLKADAEYYNADFVFPQWLIDEIEHYAR